MKIPDYNKKIKHPTYLELQEEIKRLKEEYVMLQNASDEVEEEKDKEIDRLNNTIDKVIELIENDYFEDGSFENKDEVMKLLKGSDKE